MDGRQRPGGGAGIRDRLFRRFFGALRGANLIGIGGEAMKNAEKRLILPLKKKWFDMWKSGEKPEDYR